MGQMIDYTKVRLGTGGPQGKIKKCPKCGRKGVMREYRKEGSWLCIHRAENIGIGMAAREHCSGKLEASQP